MTGIKKRWDAMLARVPVLLIAAIIALLWCLGQIGRLELAHTLPGEVRTVLSAIKPYQWQLQLTLLVLVIIVYLWHAAKLQNLIEKLRDELHAVQEKESALTDVLLDQDRVTYIATERPALDKAIAEYYRAWWELDHAGRDPNDREVRDGYVSFHHAHSEMSQWLSAIREISERVFKIEWPTRIDAKPNAPVDLTGIPPTLTKKYLDAFVEHGVQAARIDAVLAEIDTRRQTAMSRIRERLSKGAPW